MDKFEYKTFIYDTKGLFGGVVNGEGFEEEANRLGEEGWEMVSSLATAEAYGSTKSIVCIFKRKK